VSDPVATRNNAFDRNFESVICFGQSYR
jgi:hypothetical protein